MRRQLDYKPRLQIQSTLTRISLIFRLVGEGGITGDWATCDKHRRAEQLIEPDLQSVEGLNTSKNAVMFQRNKLYIHKR